MDEDVRIQGMGREALFILIFEPGLH